MPVSLQQALDGAAELDRAKRENETLYAVIKTVGSSLDLDRVLRGIVEIATGATACHACFIYFLESERLVLRAASPRYAQQVGRVEMGLDEGLTGWVARTKTPEFLRDNALKDPRMYYVPELEEERFQSMVVVPILAKSGDVIGVVVLHTEAPREFDGEVLNFLVHTASLVGGAIENAQLYQETHRRVEKLTGLAELSQALAAVTMPEELDAAVTEGTRRLLAAGACHFYRLDRKGEELTLAASDPADAPAPRPEGEATPLLLELLRRARGARKRDRGLARSLWPELDGDAPLVAPVAAGEEQLGIICCLPAARGLEFADEDAELLGAVANQTALALKKADLIARLTVESIIKEMFDALVAGSVEAARTKASEARVDLGQPHAFLCIEPAPLGANGASGWGQAAARVKAKLRRPYSRAAFDTRHERLRVLVPLVSADPGPAAKLRDACAELAEEEGLVIGITEVDRGDRDARRHVREAADAARIGRSLVPQGGVVPYEELGAYRYLVHLERADAPDDRHCRAVAELLAYDRRRRTRLVETLERYLSESCNVTASARALYVHPNTVRQRLERIERLTDLELANEDLLSLALAVKLARLHRAPAEG